MHPKILIMITKQLRTKRSDNFALFSDAIRRNSNSFRNERMIIHPNEALVQSTLHYWHPIKQGLISSLFQVIRLSNFDHRLLIMLNNSGSNQSLADQNRYEPCQFPRNIPDSTSASNSVSWRLFARRPSSTSFNIRSLKNSSLAYNCCYHYENKKRNYLRVSRKLGSFLTGFETFRTKNEHYLQFWESLRD